MSSDLGDQGPVWRKKWAGEVNISGCTHAGRKVKSEANSASNATLSRSIWANDHVQMRTRSKFDKVVGDEVLELNADNRTRHVSWVVIRYPQDTWSATYPSASLIKAAELEDPAPSPFT